MLFSANQQGMVTVVKLIGQFCFGDPVDKFSLEIRKLFNNGCVKIVLDMELINFIDSSGIGQLVECSKSARSHGGWLKLLNVPPQTLRVLETARLLSFFEIINDLSEALELSAKKQETT